MMPASTFTEEYLLQRSIPVPETGCWLWLLGTVKGGYAKGTYLGRSIIVSRKLMEIRYGELRKDQFVCHSCDVPSCVNPSHLFIGSRQDNVNDMRRKKRNAFGTRVWLAKLNEEKAQAIMKDTRPQRLIAIDYGVSESAVQALKAGETWKHVIGVQQ